MQKLCQKSPLIAKKHIFKTSLVGSFSQSIYWKLEKKIPLEIFGHLIIGLGALSFLDYKCDE